MSNSKDKTSAVLPAGKFFKSVGRASIKAVSGLAEEAGYYNRIENAAILAGIVAVILAILGTTVSSVVSSTYVNIDFPNVMKWFLIDLCEYALYTFGMAGAYFVAGRLTGKNPNYPILLAISSLAIAGGFFVRDVIGPLAVNLNYKLGIGIEYAGLIYAVLALYEGVNAVMDFKENRRIYVHIAVIGLVLIIGTLL